MKAVPSSVRLTQPIGGARQAGRRRQRRKLGDFHPDLGHHAGRMDDSQRGSRQRPGQPVQHRKLRRVVRAKDDLLRNVQVLPAISRPAMTSASARTASISS